MPPDTAALKDITTVAAWSRVFRDVAIWRPLVLAVLRRHGLADCFACLDIRSGEVSGTHAVFIVNRQLVVKIYGPFWQDDRSRELAVLRKLAGRQLLGGQVALPGLLAAGALDPRVPGSGGRPWPYLVSSYVPGTPATQVWPGLGPEARLGIGRSLGLALAEMHAIDLADLEEMPIGAEGAGNDERSRVAAVEADDPWRAGWLRFVMAQSCDAEMRHRQWDSLPEHLLAEVSGFLKRVQLPRPGWQPALLSCDITADHVLLAPEGVGWRLSGLIDLGDAMIGDPEYEFVVAILGGLDFDQAAAAALLEAYGWRPAASPKFAERLMAYMLLHRFGLFGVLRDDLREQVGAAQDLDAAAQALWGRVAGCTGG